MIRPAFLQLNFAVCAAAIMTTSVVADALPDTFDALVDIGIATSIAEREDWDVRYPSYSYNITTLLETGTYQMRLWAEIGGEMTPTGETVEYNAELVGIYDLSARTFTWSWATDAFPTLERTAALATRAYGETHGIVELTTPSQAARPGFGGVSANIASVIGHLVHEDSIQNGAEHLIFFGVTDPQSAQGES